MPPSSGLIYRYEWNHSVEAYAPKDLIPEAATLIVPPLKGSTFKGSIGRMVGFALIAFALGGMVGPLSTTFRLEAKYASLQNQEAKAVAASAAKPLPPSFPLVFAPLVTPDGASIDPVNKEFSLIIPKIGMNTGIIGSVDPTNPGIYADALKKGVAHASTSVSPDQKGTVYLFSHSTNYEWFVRDLNAVFYLLKNLDSGDYAVVFYKGKQYTYRITEKKVVKPSDVTYLYPVLGKKQLILQTCWPAGSTAERLLIFADLVDETGVKV